MTRIDIGLACARFWMSDGEALPILLRLKNDFMRQGRIPNLADQFQVAFKRLIPILPPHQIDGGNPFPRDGRAGDNLWRAYDLICKNLLDWHGYPVLRFEKLLTFGEFTKSVTVDQLHAWALATAVIDGRADERNLAARTHGALFPKIPSPALTALFGRRLIDLHQHYGASNLPTHIWAKALANPKHLLSESYQINTDRMNLPRDWRIFDLYGHVQNARFFRRLLIAFIEARRGEVLKLLNASDSYWFNKAGKIHMEINFDDLKTHFTTAFDQFRLAEDFCLLARYMRFLAEVPKHDEVSLYLAPTILPNPEWLFLILNGINPIRHSSCREADYVSTRFAGALQLAGIVNLGFVQDFANTASDDILRRLLFAEGYPGFLCHRNQQSLARARRLIGDLLLLGEVEQVRREVNDHLPKGTGVL